MVFEIVEATHFAGLVYTVKHNFTSAIATNSTKKNVVKVEQSLCLRVRLTKLELSSIHKFWKDASFCHTDSLQSGAVRGVLRAMVTIFTTNCDETCDSYGWDMS